MSRSFPSADKVLRQAHHKPGTIVLMVSDAVRGTGRLISVSYCSQSKVKGNHNVGIMNAIMNEHIL
jgi:hypothetical protein